MSETARTQRHIYVGSSLDDLRDQPGFDRAGFKTDSDRERNTSAFSHPSGADSYFIVVTNKDHRLVQNNGQTFPGSMDLSLVHEFLHPSQVMRTLAESGLLERPDSETRVQLREQKIARELGWKPGMDFPDVFESGPYEVKLDPTEAQPNSPPSGDPPQAIQPMNDESFPLLSPSPPISPISFNGALSQRPTASPPASSAPLGLVSGTPMKFFQLPIFNTRPPSTPWMI